MDVDPPEPDMRARFRETVAIVHAELMSGSAASLQGPPPPPAAPAAVPPSAPVDPEIWFFNTNIMTVNNKSK